jgi:hypothetical protein
MLSADSGVARKKVWYLISRNFFGVKSTATKELNIDHVANMVTPSSEIHL